MEQKRRSGLSIIIVLATVGALVVFFVYYRQRPGSEGSPPPPSENPEQAAELGLATLRKLITEDNFAAMGFESVEEVSAASLGDPLEIFYVPLDQLKAYQPQGEIEGMLLNSGRIIFPVIVEEQVRSSVTVSGAGTTWRATEYGGPMLMKALAKVRKVGNEFVVSVPALNLYFVAKRSDKELFLTPILDDARFEFLAGNALSAKEVFERILPAAREQEDLPTGG